jgi:hypothetical protein
MSSILPGSTRRTAYVLHELDAATDGMNERVRAVADAWDRRDPVRPLF